MARTNTLGNFLTDVADAIRKKKGTTDTILASNFDTEIASIESGVDINEYYVTSGHYGKIGGYIKKIPQLDTSNVTNMNSMFSDCENLISIPQLNTSKVTNMNNMFYYCKSLTTIPLIDTSNVKEMTNMFRGCINLTTIPQLDISNVTRTSYMFDSCTNLTTIPQLDTSNVDSMSYMFRGCTNLTTIPQLNGEKLMSIYGIVENCKNITDFNGLINLGQAYNISNPANYSNYTLNLAYSPLLTEQSIINILNNLYDIATKGCNTQTVTLGATNLAKLTSTEGQQALASAQSKGWNIN